MSLLDFFPNQRRQWVQRAAVPTADYQAGGLAALALAEADFRTTPLLNARQQATDTQHELEEVSYQLSRARRRVLQLESQLAAAQQQATDAPRQHQRRAYKARKKLRQVAEAANHLVMRPDTKLRKIQALVNGFLAQVGHDDDHDEPAETTDLPVPLRE